MGKYPLVSDVAVINKIYLIRGKKVMLDRDLAELYAVSTSRLNEQVKRNRKMRHQVGEVPGNSIDI